MYFSITNEYYVMFIGERPSPEEISLHFHGLNVEHVCKHQPKKLWLIDLWLHINTILARRVCTCIVPFNISHEIPATLDQLVDLARNVAKMYLKM